MLRMASWAHIVTENFTPGTMEDWGLGFDELREVNPGVGDVQHLDDGPGRADGAAAGLRAGAVVAGGADQPDRLARPRAGQPLRRHTPTSSCPGSPWPRFWPPSITAGVPARGLTWTCRNWKLRCIFSAPLLLDYAVNGREQGRLGNRDPGAGPSRCVPLPGRGPLDRHRLLERPTVGRLEVDRQPRGRALARRTVCHFPGPQVP